MRATPAISLGLALAVACAVPASRGAGGYALALARMAHPGPVFSVQQSMLPLDRILPVVHRAVPGRVLDVQVVGQAYRVKVLTHGGRVSHVLVDGRTGQVLRVD